MTEVTEPMLTIFALPKPFLGHTGIIQNNAIQSWTMLRPSCEIILFGDEEGTAEAAVKFGAQHIPEVECNEYGTPLVNSLFISAQKVGGHELVCYVNADIILMSDFLEAIRKIQKQSFLLIGRRWDVEVKEPINFNNPQWEEQLRSRIAKDGKLHAWSGMDYFVFHRGAYIDIPPLAIGRFAWDNWLVYKARALRLPVIDATKVVTAVHQNHDYAHLPTAGGKGERLAKQGIESERNRQLLGGRFYSFDLWDATYILSPYGLKSAMGPQYLFQRLLHFPEMHPQLTPFTDIMRGLRSAAFAVAGLRRKLKRQRQ